MKETSSVDPGGWLDVSEDGHPSSERMVKERQAYEQAEREGKHE